MYAYFFAGITMQDNFHNKTKKKNKTPDKTGKYIMKLGVVKDALRCFCKEGQLRCFAS